MFCLVENLSDSMSLSFRSLKFIAPSANSFFFFLCIIVKWFFYNVKNQFGIELWCLMPILTIVQICHDSQFYSGVPGEYHGPARNNWQSFITWYRIEYTPPWKGFEPMTLVVICIDCISSHQSNYHTITSTTTLRTSLLWFQVLQSKHSTTSFVLLNNNV